VYARLLWILVAVLLLVPAASAQTANVRARVVPQYDEVALAPSEKGGVSLDVTFTVTTACTTGTKFGVTLVLVDPFPKWAGASPEPANLQFDEQGGKKTAKLEMFPAEDAPPGQKVTYRLRPEVHLPSSANCTGEMRVDSPDALVKLTILGPDQTGQVVDTGGSSAGFEAATLGLLAVGFAGLRRRR
jgi:MYXO-CTERM domain-containing protein